MRPERKMAPLARAPDFKRRVRLELAAFAAIFAALELYWQSQVSAFQIPYHYWQLLPAPALEWNLWRALIDLHAQPPLLNLILGVLIRAESLFKLSPEDLGAGLYFAIGTITAVAYASVAMRLIARPWVRLLSVSVVLANPYLYASFSQLFYTPLELCMLMALLVLGFRYFDAPSPVRLAEALAPCVLLVYTRSLFSPAWFVLVAAALVVLSGRRGLNDWKKYVAVVGIALLLVLAWPAKNLARFGFFDYSSWTGLNLAHGLPVMNPVAADGFTRRQLDPQVAALRDARVPEPMRADPGLAQAMKPGGYPNWNHFTIIEDSKAVGSEALRGLMSHPSLLWKRACVFYFGGFATYEARDPYHDLFALDMARAVPTESDVAAAAGWFRWYERVFFQRFRGSTAPLMGRMTTGFAVAFPVLVVLAAGSLWVRRRRFGPGEKIVLLMMVCVLWVLAMALFVDGIEGNRMRFSTEPFVVLMAGYALTSLLDRKPSRLGREVAPRGSIPLATTPSSAKRAG